MKAAGIVLGLLMGVAILVVVDLWLWLHVGIVVALLASLLILGLASALFKDALATMAGRQGWQQQGRILKPSSTRLAPGWQQRIAAHDALGGPSGIGPSVASDYRLGGEMHTKHHCDECGHYIGEEECWHKPGTPPCSCPSCALARKELQG